MENKFYILFENFKPSVRDKIIGLKTMKQTISLVDIENFKQKLIEYNNSTIVGYFDIENFKISIIINHSSIYLTSETIAITIRDLKENILYMIIDKMKKPVSITNFIQTYICINKTDVLGYFNIPNLIFITPSSNKLINEYISNPITIESNSDTIESNSDIVDNNSFEDSEQNIDNLADNMVNYLIENVVNDINTENEVNDNIDLNISQPDLSNFNNFKIIPYDEENVVLVPSEEFIIDVYKNNSNEIYNSLLNSCCDGYGNLGTWCHTNTGWIFNKDSISNLITNGAYFDESFTIEYFKKYGYKIEE